MSTPAPVVFDPPTRLSYGALHARACVRALRQGAARWVIYGVVAAALVGAGADLASAWAALQALAAWVVAPLFWAVSQGPAAALLATVLQALVGAGLLAGMRQWLWPSRWAEQERALPIPPRGIRRSDLRMLAWALLPWALLCGLGGLVWLWRQPAWLQGHRGPALVALGVALAASWLGGAAMQRWRRQRGARPGSKALASTATRLDHRRTVRPLHWSAALVAWPLWRGVAPRTGATLALGAVAVLLPAVGVILVPRSAPWWLAAQSLLALVLTSRLRPLVALELKPLADACQPLPLAPARLVAARHALSATPLALGLAATGLAVVGAVPADQLRGARMAAWAACVALAGAMELRWTHRDPGVKAARWLFMLVLSVALGSEVWR